MASTAQWVKSIILLLGIAAMFAVVLTFSGTTLAMTATWYESNSFNHCFLVLPISAYLAWQKRAALAKAKFEPDWRGGVAIVIASLTWLLGDVTGTLLIQEVSLILTLQSLVLLIYGRAVFRIVLFPLLYLFFAVPFGLEFIPPLQTVTALLSVGLLKLVGLPVFSDGYLISIPGGNWYVADACSGIRYVISSLALGALFAGTMYVTWWRRALVLVVSIVVPILANGIRAAGIILLAYLSDNELATGVDHLIYGWLFFTLVSGLVLAVGMSFRETRGTDDNPNAAVARGASIPACLFATILALMPVGAARAYGDYIDAAWDKRAIQLDAPDIADYRHVAAAADDPFLPRFTGADSVLDAGYQKGDAIIYLRVGYYLSERRGIQAISLNHELPGSPEMLIVGKGSMTAMIGAAPIAVRYQRIASGNRGRLIWYWYWIDGRLTGDAYFAKLLEAKAKLFGGRQQAAVIALASDYRGDAASAESALHDFAIGSGPLYSALDHARRP